jgi:hypothetical protein
VGSRRNHHNYHLNKNRIKKSKEALRSLFFLITQPFSFHHHPEAPMFFLFFLILFTAPLCLSATDTLDPREERKTAPLKESEIDAQNKEEIARIDAILRNRAALADLREWERVKHMMMMGGADTA